MPGGLIANFPHTCTIKREREVRTAYIGMERTLETIASDVDCFVQPLRQKDQVEFDRREMRVTHAVYFNVDYALDTNYVLVRNNKEYKVIAYDDASSGVGIVWKAMVFYTPDEATA